MHQPRNEPNMIEMQALTIMVIGNAIIVMHNTDLIVQLSSQKTTLILYPKVPKNEKLKT